MIREYLYIWCTVLIISTGTILIFVFGALNNPKTTIDILGSDTSTPPPKFIIVGSSLTGAAFPPEPVSSDVPWDATTQRWFINGITDALQLGLIDQAIAQNVYTVVAEVSPIVRLPHSTRNNFSARFAELALTARKGLKQLLKVDDLEIDHSSLLSESEFVGNTYESSYATKYKEITRIPRSHLLTKSSSLWLSNKIDKTVDFVFVSFPRARSLILSSTIQHEELRRQERKIAKSLGIPLFEPDIFWSDEYFADLVHLNSTGRARYLSEFRAWWDSR